MRFCLIFFLCLSFLAPVSAQPKVTFQNNGTGSFQYPAKELDSFLQLARYKAVIFGENHTVFFEPDFKYHLIRQLNDTYGIHDVFMEIGHAAAWLFNSYLQTGDTALLVQPALVYTWSNGHYRQFWDSLRLYNNQLPEAKRIVIHGADFERAEMFKALLLLRPAGKSIPAELAEGFRLATQYAAHPITNTFDKELLRQQEEIKHILNSQEISLRDYYGEHYAIVNYILHNNAPHTMRVPQRNKFMIQAMASIITRQHITGFAGFFGNSHTAYQNNGSLVNKLNKLDAFKGKILSLNAVYFNAYSTASRQYLNYIGMINAGHSTLLHDTYLGDDRRAVLLRNRDIAEDKFLHKAADFVLLVNDTATMQHP